MDRTEFSQTLRSAILAGFAIGIGGCANLSLQGGIPGAVLFTIGLLTVVHYRFALFTGTAGFYKRKEETKLLVILLGNILGCLLLGLLSRCATLPLEERAQAIIQARLDNGPLNCFILSIGCGFLMTTAVQFGREGRFLPLLFAVPAFIICGFPHCIADAYYLLTTPVDFISANALPILIFYVSIVLGNFVGCNIKRWVLP